eukprot:403336175
MDFNDCQDDFKLGGFDSDNLNNVYSGYIEHSSTSSCSAFSNLNSGLISFVSLVLDQDVKWVRLLLGESSIKFQNSIIADLSVVTTAISDNEFRLIKSRLTNGETLNHVKLNSFLVSESANSIIYDHSFIRNKANGDFYLSINFQSELFLEQKEAHNIIIRLNSNMGVMWAQRFYPKTGYTSFSGLDTTLTSNQVLTLNQFYSTSGSQYNSIVMMNQTSNQLNSIIKIMANSTYTDSYFGAIKLNRNQDRWYTMIKEGDSGYLTFQMGKIATVSTTANVKTNIIMTQPNLYVYSNDTVIVSGILNNRYQMLLKIDLSTLQIIQKSINYNQRSVQYAQSTMISKFTDGYVYLVLNQPRTVDSITKQRIILSQTSLDTLEQSLSTCFSYFQYELASQFIAKNIDQSTESDAYSKINISLSNSLLTTSLTASSTNLDQISLLYEYIDQTTEGTFSPTEISYGNTVGLISYDLSYKDCKGYKYKITQVKFLNDSNLHSFIQFNQVKQKLTITLTLAELKEKIGTFTLKVTAQYGTLLIEKYIRVTLYLPQAIADADATQNQDILSTCNLPIYPLYYGGTRQVYTKFLGFDQTDYIMMAGSSNQIPFSDEKSLVPNGFFALMDNYGRHLWAYRVDNQVSKSNQKAYSICDHMADSSSYYVVICQTQSQNYPEQQLVPSFTRLQKNSGKIDYVKEIYFNNNGISYQEALFSYIDSDQTLYIALRYGTSFAIVSLDLITYKNNFIKNYPGLNNYATMYQFVVDLSYLYVFRGYSGTTFAIHQFTLATGEISSLINLKKGNSDGTQLSHITTDYIYSPLLTRGTQDIIYLYQIDKATNLLVLGTKITLSSLLDISSVSVIVEDSLDEDIYIVASGSNTIILKLTSAFVISENYYIVDYSGSLNVLNIKNANGGIMFGITGSYMINQANSTFIFKLDYTNMVQDNCFDMKSDSSLFTIETASTDFTNSVEIMSIINYLTFDQYMATQSGIYEDALNVAIFTQSFGDDSESQQWSNNLISNKYHKYPYNLNQCGGYALQDVVQETVFSYSYTLGTGSKTITLTQPDNSCQERVQAIEVVLKNKINQDSNYNFFSFDQETNELIINTDMITKSTVFTFQVRYSDKYWNSSYYIVPITVSILSSTSLVVPVPSVTCSHNIYPMSFGGGCSNCKLTTFGIQVDPSTEDIYSIGSADTWNSFVNSTKQLSVGYVMKLSSLGLVKWFTQLQLSMNSYDQVQSSTISNDYIYACISTAEQLDYAIVKLDSDNGRLIWAKKINAYENNIQISIKNIRDIHIDPSDDQNILISTQFEYDSQQTSGFILTIDDGTDYDATFFSRVATSASLKHTVGQSLYDGSGYFITTSMRFGSSSGQLLVNKHDSDTPTTTAWLRSFNLDDVPSYYNTLNPAIVIDDSSPYNLYIAAITQHANIIKIASGGTTQAHITLQFTTNSLQSIDILYDTTNDRLVVFGLAIDNNGLQIIALDNSLAQVSAVGIIYDGFEQARSAGRLVSFGLSDSFFYSYNVKSFGHLKKQGSEVLFNKRSIFQAQANEYDCNTEGSSTFTAIVTSVTLKSESLVTITTTSVNWLSYDQDSIYSLEQQENLQRVILANSMNALPDKKLMSEECDGQTGTRYPQYSYKTPIDITLGTAQTVVVDTSTISQCQGIEIEHSIFLESGDTTSNIGNDFMTISGTSIAIDTLTKTPMSGSRQIQIKSCIKGQSDMCTVSEQTIKLLPSTIYTKPFISESCDLPTDYPKVLGNSMSDTVIYDSDIRTSDSTFVVCGYVTDGYFAQSYYQDNGKSGFIMNYDKDGDISWAYSISHINGQNSTYQSCKVNQGESSIYALISISETNQLIVAKHSLNQGKLVYSLKLNGTYQTTNQLSKLYMDETNDAIYVIAQPSFLSTEPQIYSQTIMKIDLSSEPLQQTWIRRLKMTASTDQGLQINQLAVGSTNLYSVGQIQVSNQKYVNLIKIAVSDGTSSSSKSYLAEVTNPQFQVIFDATNVFLFYGSFGSDTMRRFITKFDSSLSYQSSIYYDISDASDNLLISVDNDASNIYEIFSVSNSKAYFTKYAKASLSLSTIKSFELDGLSSLSLSLQTQSTYINENYAASAIFRLDLTLGQSNDCLTIASESISATIGSDNSVDLTSSLTEIVYTTSLNLESYLGLIWERHQDYVDLQFQTMDKLDCAQTGITFGNDLTDQVVTIPETAVEYSIPLHNVCSGSGYSVSLSVDDEASVPSFITTSQTSTDFVVAFAPVLGDEGIYTIRVNYQNSNGVDLDKTFNLHVYPEYEIGYEVVDFECPTNFMQWHKDTEIVYSSADVDPNSSNLIICGGDLIDDGVNPEHWQGFISQLTQGFATLQHISIAIDSNLNSIVQKCLYGNQGTIQSIVNVENVASTLNDKIYLFQHSVEGKVQYAKQFLNTNKLLQSQDYFVDLISGDQYLNGLVDNQYLSYNSKSFFIMKLKSNYRVQHYKVYAFGTQSEANKISLNSGMNQLNSIFGYQNEEDSTFNWGIIQLNTETFKQEWIRVLQNEDKITRDISKSLNQMDLIYQDDYLYSCLTYLVDGENGLISQWSLSQYNTTEGSILQAIEMNRQLEDINSCELTYHEDEEILIMTLGFYEETYLLPVNISNTDNMQLLATRALSLYTYRQSPFITSTHSKSSSLYLFVKSFSFDDESEHLFFAKSSSLLKQQWDLPCTNNTIQLVSTNIIYYFFNPQQTGVNGNLSQYWIDYTEVLSKSVSSLYIEDEHFQNAQDFSIKIESTNEYLMKETYAECLGYNYPNIPEDYKDISGEISDTSEGAVIVGADDHIFILPVFPQCSNDLITYSLLFDSGVLPTWIVFDPVLRTLTMTPDDNDYAGTYTLTYIATITDDLTIVNQVDIELEIQLNQPPTASEDFKSEFTLSTFHENTWIIVLDSDPESDTAIFDVDLLNNAALSVLASSSWFTIDNSDDQGITFTASNPTYNNAGSNEYTIRVSVYDDFNVDTPTVYDITLTIIENQGAVLDSSVSLTLASSFIAATYSQNFTASNFVDLEEDAQTISCTNSATNSASTTWITSTTDPLTGDLAIGGTVPSSASNIATYTFSCIATDEFGAVSITYNFILSVVANADIAVSQYSDQAIVKNGINDLLEMDLSQTCVDSQDETISYILYINNTVYDSAIHDTWFAWDATSLQLSFDFVDNTKAETFVIKLECSDGYNTAKSMTYTLTATANLPLTNTDTIDDIVIFLADTTISLGITYIENFFTDPEGYEITLSLREVGDTDLPAFITDFEAETGSISLSSDETMIGIYSMELVGTDNIGQETTVPFTIQLEECYETCYTCTDILDNTCLTCKDEKYFYNNQCIYACPDGTYDEPEAKECIDCPIECSKCFGPENNEHCSECQTGYFMLGNGCFDECPDNYWGDPSDQQCKQIDTSDYLLCFDLKQLFETTDAYRSSFNDIASEEQTCTDNLLCADDTSGEDGCVWNRKLTVRCTYDADAQTLITVQTNSLPNHCMHSGDVKLPSEKLVSFQVAFNLKKTALSALNLNTQAKVNQYLCNQAWQNALDTKPIYKYTGILGNEVPYVGVSLNGVLILTGNSAVSIDAFYPTTISASTIIDFDVCLGNSLNRAYYHYLSFSPCIFSSTPRNKVNAMECEEISQCSANELKYGISFLTSAQKKVSPIGIARDGHMIVGPYNSNGVLWQPCQLDVCNGVTINGNYVYAVTMFHPYTIGCWGPGNVKAYKETCSSNVQLCSDESSSITNIDIYRGTYLYLLFIALSIILMQ